MVAIEDSVFALYEQAKKKAPSYFRLLGANTDSEFDDALDAVLQEAICQIEQNGKNFYRLDENALTSILSMALSMPGLLVKTEGYSNGHVDIVIEAEHCSPKRRKLGEAKIYRGPAYHVSGLNQLLNRYTTGREGRGLLIVYVRQQNIAGLIKGIRDRMDADLPCNQKGPTIDHSLKWSFLSTHAHSCGEDLQVSHIGCNLFVNQGARSNGEDA